MKNISVDLKKHVQDNFMGLSAVYHGFASMPDDAQRTYPDEWAELEADRAKELGIKNVRTFFKWYAWEPETKTFNWENDACKGFYKWLSRMQKRGIDVSVNTGWHLPKDVYAEPFKVEGDWYKSVQNYADWVSETVHQLIEVHGFTNVKYLHIFTEPARMCGDNGTHEDPNKTSLEAWGDCIKAVHETLIRDGRRQLVKLVGPNEGGGYNMMVQVANSQYAKYLDIYAAHQYQNADLLRLRNKGKFANSGEVAVTFNVPNSKYFQPVELKENTEYKVSVYLKIDTDNSTTVTGYVQYGVFEFVDEVITGFVAGRGKDTKRIERFSVKSVEANELSEQWQKFEFVFLNTKKTKASFGVYSDVTNNNSIVVLDDPFIAEVGTNDNLLISSDLTDTVGWGHGAAFPATLDSADYMRIFGELAIGHIKDGKPFWHDEFNIARICGNVDPESAKHGTDLARVFCGIMSSGAQNAIMWSLFDQIWPSGHANNSDSFVDGDHRCGVMPVFHRSFIPKPDYYAVGLLGNFFGGKGCKTYSLPFEDFLEVGVNLMEGSNVSVLVVNSKYEEDTFSIDFVESINKTFYRYVYNPQEIVPTEQAVGIKSDKEFLVDNKFSDVLPPYSFAVYTTIKK